MQVKDFLEDLIVLKIKDIHLPFKKIKTIFLLKSVENKLSNSKIINNNNKHTLEIIPAIQI